MWIRARRARKTRGHGARRAAPAGRAPGQLPGESDSALRASMPQRASAMSSVLRASTQRAPSGVVSYFQKGAWVLR